MQKWSVPMVFSPSPKPASPIASSYSHSMVSKKMLKIAPSHPVPLLTLLSLTPSSPVEPSKKGKKKKKTHGNNPIPLTFHTPNPNATQFINTYTTLTPHNFPLVPSLSNRANTSCVCSSACSGFLNSINTIMIEKI